MKDASIAFLGGLHRSGTSPLARWIGEHPDVSAFAETGVWEDEGQHLQDVFPTAAAHGGPGRFAFDPEAHLTESSPLVSEASRARLWDAWSPHWDTSKHVLLEKSPPNLVRTRFLQAMFPTARFVVVIRHPIAVSYATRKWFRRWRRLGLRSLLEHWITAHELFLADARRLEAVALVRYEDLVADTDRELSAIFRFLGLTPFTGRPAVSRGVNDRYLSRWHVHPANVAKRASRLVLARRLEDRVRPFGYSLTAPSEIGRPSEEVARLMPAGSG